LQKEREKRYAQVSSMELLVKEDSLSAFESLSPTIEANLNNEKIKHAYDMLLSARDGTLTGSQSPEIFIHSFLKDILRLLFSTDPALVPKKFVVKNSMGDVMNFKISPNYKKYEELSKKMKAEKEVSAWNSFDQLNLLYTASLGYRKLLENEDWNWNSVVGVHLSMLREEYLNIAEGKSGSNAFFIRSNIETHLLRLLNYLTDSLVLQQSSVFSTKEGSLTKNLPDKYEGTLNFGLLRLETGLCELYYRDELVGSALNLSKLGALVLITLLKRRRVVPLEEMQEELILMKNMDPKDPNDEIRTLSQGEINRQLKNFLIEDCNLTQEQYDLSIERIKGSGTRIFPPDM